MASRSYVLVLNMRTFFIAALSALPLLATSVSPTHVAMQGATATQAIITYQSPYACSIEASEGASIGTLVHDVDTSLFSGSNLDTRTGQVPAIGGTFHQFVLGTKAAQKASDNKYYSRALQAYTQHTARITCPAGTADGNSVSISFTTDNINSTTFTLPTAEADPLNPGTEAIPTWDWSDRTQKVVDPKTGALIRHMAFIRQELTGGTGDYPFAFASGTNWTYPNNALLDNGSFATYTAGGQDVICFRQDTVFDAGKQIGGITFELTGKVADGSTSPQQDVEVAMSLDGCQTANSPWLTITLPKAADYSGQTENAGDDITTPVPVMAAWLVAGQTPPTVLDTSMRTGTVNTIGTDVQWNNQGAGQVFPFNWSAGTPIEINTADAGSPPYTSFTWSSLDTAFHGILGSPAGTHTNVAFRSPTFGFMVRPKVAAARTVSLEYARIWVNMYAGLRTNGGDGMSTMCSMKATPEAAVITAATNATPIVLTVSPAQTWVTGNTITVAGVAGNTAANGTWLVHKVDTTHFSLDTSVGNSAYTKHGIAYPPTARTGYQCAALTALPGDYQYSWTATSDGSGDSHYLGPLRVSGSSGGSSYSGICAGNTIPWDWTSDPVYFKNYCILPDDSHAGKFLLLGATYIGNPTLGYNAEVGSLPNGGNADTLASWDIEILSNDIVSDYVGFDNRYDGTVFGAGNVDGFQGGRVTLLSRGGNQDTMGWRIVYDPVTKAVTAMMPSMLQLPAAYCSIHTANTNTFNPFITTTLKNLIYEGGGQYNGPYFSQITSNGGTGTGSVSATLGFCDTLISGIGQTDLLGLGHIQQCSQITVGSEPITPGSVVPANSILMPAPIGQPMQFEPGIVFDGNLSGERIRLAAKSGSTWILQRGYYSHADSPPPPAAQPAGSYLEPLCGALPYQILPPLNQDCCLVWWDPVNDPHAANANDPYARQGGDGSTPYPADAVPAKQVCNSCTMRKEDTFAKLGHYATGSSQDQTIGITLNDNGNNNFFPLDATGYDSPFWQAIAIRYHGWPGQLTEYHSTSIGITSPWAGVFGDLVGNNADIHPSTNYTTNQNLMYSANPIGVGPGFPGTVTPISGQLYKMTAFIPGNAAPLDMKRNQMVVQAGHNAPLNVSGPSCSIGTGAGDSWKWGLVYKANECVSGSVPGEVYINAPGISPGPQGSFIAGVYTPFDKASPYTLARDLVVATAGSLSDHLVQYVATNVPDVAGNSARKLTTLLNGTKNMGRTENYRPLADGTWAWANWQANNNGPFDVLLIKTPPFPSAATSNRTDYIPAPIRLHPPSSLAVDNAIVEFGYDSSLNCINRTGESCVAAPSQNPYYYSTADAPITGAACSTTCSFTINAVPNSIVYWRYRYRNASNTTLAVGPISTLTIQ